MKKQSQIVKARKEAREVMHYYENPDWNRRTHAVHHLDGDPLNNDSVNLLVVTIPEHRLIHTLQQVHKIPYNGKCEADGVACRYCGRELFNGKCLCGRRRKK